MTLVPCGDVLFRTGITSVKCLVCQMWLHCESFAGHLLTWKHDHKNLLKRLIEEIDVFLKRVVFNAMD